MTFKTAQDMVPSTYYVHDIPSFLIKDVLKNRFVFFYIEMYSQITQTIYVILTILFNKLYFSKDETYDGK